MPTDPPTALHSHNLARNLARTLAGDEGFAGACQTAFGTLPSVFLDSTGARDWDDLYPFAVVFPSAENFGKGDRTIALNVLLCVRALGDEPGSAKPFLVEQDPPVETTQEPSTEPDEPGESGDDAESGDDTESGDGTESGDDGEPGETQEEPDADEPSSAPARTTDGYYEMPGAGALETVADSIVAAVRDASIGAVLDDWSADWDFGSEWPEQSALLTFNFRNLFAFPPQQT